jgi:tetratricopeptide (TPR) repeat protein
MNRLPVFVVTLLCAMSLACHRTGRSAADLVQRGDDLAASGQQAAAILEYRAAIQRDAKFGLAHQRLADAYMKSGEPQNLRLAIREYVVAADLLPGDLDAQLKAGQALLLARRFEDARTAAERVLAKDPKNVGAYILKGSALAGLKDPEGALDDINEAITANPEDARSYAALGSLEFVNGRMPEAEAAFKRGIEAQPESQSAQLALATFYASAGRLKDAETPLKRAIEIDPSNPVAQRGLAILYLASGQVAEAEAPLQAAARDPKDFRSRMLLADYYARRGRSADARSLLREIAADHEGFAPATLRLAQLDRLEHHPDDADRQLDAVLTAQPANVNALVLKGRFLLEDGKVDDALVRARAAVAADSRSAPAQALLALVAIRKHDLDGAIAAMTEVTKLNPRLVSARVELADLHLQKGSTSTALELAEQANRAAPKSVSTRLMLARVAAARGDASRADGLLRELMAEHPDAPSLYVQAAQFALQRNDRPAARKYFSRAMELAPASVSALQGIVALDLVERNFGHARELIDARLKQSPSDRRVQLLAADLAGATGDVQHEETLLRSLVEAGDASAFGRLAGLYLQQHKLDQARAEFERIAREYPNSPAAPTMIGMILEAQNRPVDAQKIYESVVAARSDAPLAANNLAWLYAERGGNLDVALQLAQSAKRQLPDLPQIDDTLGWVYYKKDLAELAIPPLQAGVQRDPRNAAFQFHLGLAYMKAGNETQARTAFDAALRQKPDFQDARAARDALVTR